MENGLMSATDPPETVRSGERRVLKLPNGTIIDPATDADIREAKDAWMRDLSKRFMLDLRLQIIEKKMELKALQLRLRAERPPSKRKEAPRG